MRTTVWLRMEHHYLCAKLLPSILKQTPKQYNGTTVTSRPGKRPHALRSNLRYRPDVLVFITSLAMSFDPELSECTPQPEQPSLSFHTHAHGYCLYRSRYGVSRIRTTRMGLVATCSTSICRLTGKLVFNGKTPSSSQKRQETGTTRYNIWHQHE